MSLFRQVVFKPSVYSKKGNPSRGDEVHVEVQTDPNSERSTVWVHARHAKSDWLRLYLHSASFKIEKTYTYAEATAVARDMQWFLDEVCRTYGKQGVAAPLRYTVVCCEEEMDSHGLPRLLNANHTYRLPHEHRQVSIPHYPEEQQKGPEYDWTTATTVYHTCSLMEVLHVAAVEQVVFPPERTRVIVSEMKRPDPGGNMLREERGDDMLYDPRVIYEPIGFRSAKEMPPLTAAVAELNAEYHKYTALVQRVKATTKHHVEGGIHFMSMRVLDHESHRVLFEHSWLSPFAAACVDPWLTLGTVLDTLYVNPAVSGVKTKVPYLLWPVPKSYVKRAAYDKVAFTVNELRVLKWEVEQVNQRLTGILQQ